MTEEITRDQTPPPMSLDEVSDWMTDFCTANMKMVGESERVVSHALWYLEQLQERKDQLEKAIKDHKQKAHGALFASDMEKVDAELWAVL